MKTKRDLAIEQIELQEKIQKETNINIINCCNCGTVLMYEMQPIEEDEKPIDCFGCREEVYPNDCADFWYSGCEGDTEFYEDKFDPIENTPVTYEVFNTDNVSQLKTNSLNKASDKSVTIGNCYIIGTDSKGNVKKLK